MSPSGTAYAAHFDTLAARGVDVHAEARLVTSLVAPGGSVLDAGCGTGRVAIRLAASGYRVAGVDLDPSMLAEARRRAPSLDWRLADLADLEIPGAAPFDAAVAAGNLFPYLTAGTGTAVSIAAQLRPGGLLIVHARPREVAVWRSARRKGHARPLRPVVYSRGTVAAAPLGELGTCALRRR